MKKIVALCVCMVAMPQVMPLENKAMIGFGIGAGVCAAGFLGATIVELVQQYRNRHNKDVDYQKIAKKIFSKDVLHGLDELRVKDPATFYAVVTQILSAIGCAVCVTGFGIAWHKRNQNKEEVDDSIVLETKTPDGGEGGEKTLEKDDEDKCLLEKTESEKGVDDQGMTPENEEDSEKEENESVGEEEGEGEEDIEEDGAVGSDGEDGLPEKDDVGDDTEEHEHKEKEPEKILPDVVDREGASSPTQDEDGREEVKELVGSVIAKISVKDEVNEIFGRVIEACEEYERAKHDMETGAVAKTFVLRLTKDYYIDEIGCTTGRCQFRLYEPVAVGDETVSYFIEAWDNECKEHKHKLILRFCEGGSKGLAFDLHKKQDEQDVMLVHVMLSKGGGKKEGTKSFVEFQELVCDKMFMNDKGLLQVLAANKFQPKRPHMDVHLLKSLGKEVADGYYMLYDMSTKGNELVPKHITFTDQWHGCRDDVLTYYFITSSGVESQKVKCSLFAHKEGSSYRVHLKTVNEKTRKAHDVLHFSIDTKGESKIKGFSEFKDKLHEAFFRGERCMVQQMSGRNFELSIPEQDSCIETFLGRLVKPSSKFVSVRKGNEVTLSPVVMSKKRKKKKPRNQKQQKHLRRLAKQQKKKKKYKKKKR